MIDAVRVLLDEYATWLRDKTTLRQLDNEWADVTTPFLDRHNDHVQFFVRASADGYVLTDDSYTIQDLENSGCDLASKKRQDLLRIALAGFGVRLEGDALEVSATQSDFAQKKHRLIQAMLAVNDMFYTTPTTVATLFVEDVSNWLASADIRFTPAVKFAGSSGYDHTFDFVIPASRNAPERIVQTINRPTRDSVEAVAFAWIDTHEVRRPEARAFVMLNDRENRLPRGATTTLRTYGITSVPWTKRDTVREALAARLLI